MGWNHQLAKHVDDVDEDDDNTDDVLMMPSNTNHMTMIWYPKYIWENFPHMLQSLPSAKWFWVVGLVLDT